MDFNKKIVKLMLIFLAAGLALWLGGTVIRSATAFDLYVPATELQIKNWYSNDTQMQTVHIYGLAAFYTDIGYGIALATIIFFGVYWRKNLRRRGWMFMALVLFLLSAPIELYLIYLDIKLNLALGSGSVVHFSDKIIKDYFIVRFTKLTIPSTLSMLAGVTAIILMIWRPLDNIAKDKPLNK